MKTLFIVFVLMFSLVSMSFADDTTVKRMEKRGERYEKMAGTKMNQDVLDNVAASFAMITKKRMHPSEVKSGYNEISFKTVDFGHQQMIMEKDVPIKMRDGVTLYVNVFRPMKPGKYPVVMSACLYNKDSINDFFIDTFHLHGGTVKTSPFTPFESPDPGFWVPNGYAVVKVAVRGSSNSEGDLYPFSQTEAKDYYELIEWAGVQEWSDGNVGLNGVSYLAMLQWYVAALNPPHLKAIIPWEGGVDLYREFSFHGGMPETMFTQFWDSVCYEMINPNAKMEFLSMTAKEHPFYDAYWEGKRAKCENITVPMYVATSWSTVGIHTRGTIEGFKQSPSKNKWLEIHGRKEWEYYYLRETLERQKAFFDYFLKGVENDWMDTPRVLLEVRNRFFNGQFRYENEWPIARTKPTPLYLDGNDMLLRTSPIKKKAKIVYNADPAQKANAIFKIVFLQDTELTGNMKLKLWVSAEGADDMDLFIGIKKYDKRGKEINFPDFDVVEHGMVAHGWLRVSHRELDEKRSTPLQPWLKHQRALKLKEGEIVPVEIEIPPSSTVFKAGESLGLVIQNCDIIVYNPPEFGSMHRDTVNKGRHVIYTGGSYDSHLLVPVIPPKEATARR
jgi:predicted acyl esterase